MEVVEASTEVMEVAGISTPILWVSIAFSVVPLISKSRVVSTSIGVHELPPLQSALRRRGSVVKYICFVFALSFFFLFFFCGIVFLYLLCRVSAQHFPWKSGGVIIFCYILLYTLLLVPSCWRMYVVHAVSSSVCILHIEQFPYSSTPSTRVDCGSC